jgi:asparagine synthase (glutamine-hydrolysing)
MCGFTGFFSNNKELINRNELIKKMSDTIIHRGPDSDGYFTDAYVALGFRRLSIIDLEGGHQPIHSADGRYVIIFNGEIYNFMEIRKKLIEENGCTFATNSDTEVILNT